MTLTGERPAAAPLAVRARRRTRVLVRAAVAAVPLAVAAGAVAGVARVSLDPDAFRVQPAGRVSTDRDEDGLAYAYDFVPGGTVRVDVRLRNAGPLPVTVTLPVEEALPGDPADAGPSTRRVRVGGHGSRWVTLTYRMDGCMGRDSGLVVGSVPVGVAVAGVTYHRSLDLPVAVGLHARTTSAACGEVAQ